MSTRNRRVKRFLVVREERIIVRFVVEATSALNARRTPTPAGASRFLGSATVGEAHEQPGARASRYSLPGSEHAIANPSSTGEYGATS